jgi:integrase
MGNKSVEGITRREIAEFHHSLSHIPIAANRCISLLSKAFNLAELWGYRSLNTNPCKHIQRYKEKRKERFLSSDEIIRLNQAIVQCFAKGKLLACEANALRLLMLTGARLSEILKLKWEYVDYHRGILNLPDSKTGAKFIHLSSCAVQILETIWEDPLRSPTNPYVIGGRKHDSHLVNLQKAWCRVRQAAGLDDVRMHDLRHTFASIGVANGLSLPVIGGLLGHTQTSTTARYAHLCGAVLKDAVGQIGKSISHAMKQDKPPTEQ